jgi:hypothetical protein
MRWNPRLSTRTILSIVPIAIQSTNDAADPVAWRQWHHWNVMKDMARVKLAAGKNVLTVRILTEGNMNLATFQFKPV